jgi:uncharacterized membrane protein YqiK
MTYLAIITALPISVLMVATLLGVRYIPNKRIGIAEKRWSSRGSVETGLIALNGEAGFQPHVLRGGIHWLMPFQYSVHILPLVRFRRGESATLSLATGKPLPSTQALASNTRANNFEDAAAFLRSGRATRPAAPDPPRRHLRDQPRAIHRHNERADLLPTTPSR